MANPSPITIVRPRHIPLIATECSVNTLSQILTETQDVSRRYVSTCKLYNYPEEISLYVIDSTSTVDRDDERSSTPSFP